MNGYKEDYDKRAHITHEEKYMSLLFRAAGTFKCIPRAPIISIVLMLALLTGAQAEEDSATASHRIPDIRIDHAVVSLSPERFEALSAYLKEKFSPATWFENTSSGKGALFTNSNRVYAEIWNYGGPGINGPSMIGDQVAFGSSDEQEGLGRAQDFYGHEGLDYANMGAAGLKTVGSEFASGHPLGGTFFCAYGGLMDFEQPPSGLEALEQFDLALPARRMNEADSYRAFGFEEQVLEDGLLFTDTFGASVKLTEMPNQEVLSFGSLALRFKLAEPLSETRIEEIGEPNLNLKAVHHGDTFWLVFRPDLFDVEASIAEVGASVMESQ
ncbi:MAG: hypothetical protein V2J20_03835 [Wenzhouxiangella sp.]|jgi:hypothetical protein|nr:hypothetical protein [Wenzhouxiangella sp.]